MTVERLIRIFAGAFVLVSLALGVEAHQLLDASLPVGALADQDRVDEDLWR